jgi:NAD(P)-dependent dehydrogenase (short-subunit alcohol dehydrogenase family)
MKTVLLTGGSRGLGAAISLELVQSSYHVISPKRDELDLESRQSVENFIYQHRNLCVDILINNAGINILQDFGDIEFESWDRMHTINLLAPFKLIQAFAPGMVSRNWGRILNISTIFSLVTKEKRVCYSTTKSALNALTRSAAVEFGSNGVLVNSLAPGYVETDLTRQNNSAEALENISKGIPLKRLAAPVEIAKTARFLVSDENTYLTGQTIVVDGGYTCL